MNIACLVLEDSQPYSLFKASEMFQFSNKIGSLYANMTKPFAVNFVTIDHSDTMVSKEIIFTSTSTIDDSTSYDLIIVPSITMESGEDIVDKYGLTSEWLVSQYEMGSVLCSLCTGAFLIANTGLLNGHDATTHWAFAKDFREMFPKIKYDENKVFTVNPSKRVYTSAGSDHASYLILYFIKSKFGSNVASKVAKGFGIDMSGASHKFLHDINEEDAIAGSRVYDAIKFMEDHYKNDISMDEIANSVSLSTRHFSRIFKRETGITAQAYIKKIRIKEARKLLEETGLSVKEIMYRVGYSDPKSFRKAFFKLTSLSPTQFRSVVSLAVLDEMT